MRKKTKIVLVDRFTGKPSNEPDAISINSWHANRMVDPDTGQPSNADNSIKNSRYKATRLVDPHTGKLSNADDAVTREYFYAHRMVDRHTGKTSTAAYAIPFARYKANQMVDPRTGKLSNADDAVTRDAWHASKKLNRHTGKPDNSVDAITKATYHGQKKVDPSTGMPSNDKKAIPKSRYIAQQRVDSLTGESSNGENTTSYNAFQHKKSRQKKRETETIASCKRKRKHPEQDEVRKNKKAKLSTPILISDEETMIEDDPSLIMVFKVVDVLSAIEANAEEIEPSVCEIMDEPTFISHEEIMVEDDPSLRMVFKMEDVLAAIENNNAEMEISIIEESLQAVSTVNIEEFRKVARILRGNDQANSNCAYLAKCFIDYLRTGKIPTQAAPTDEASYEQFKVNYYKELMPVQVKSESDISVLSKRAKQTMTVYESIIDRNTTLGELAPMGQIPQIINGVTDLTKPPIFDIDNSPQTARQYNLMNNDLLLKAKEYGGYCFGICNLARHGRAVRKHGHTIVFFATDKQVIYIDCQDDKNPVFEDLTQSFSFADNPTSQETMGNIVFYAIYSKSNQPGFAENLHEIEFSAIDNASTPEQGMDMAFHNIQIDNPGRPYCFFSTRVIEAVSHADPAEKRIMNLS